MRHGAVRSNVTVVTVDVVAVVATVVTVVVVVTVLVVDVAPAQARTLQYIGSFDPGIVSVLDGFASEHTFGST